MGGNSGGRPGTQTTIVEPWKEQQPALKQLMARAQENSLQPRTMYPGQLTAQPTALETEGQQGIVNAARWKIPGQVSNVLSAQDFALNLPQNVTTNPAVTGQIDAVQGRLNDNLNQNIIPGIQGGAVQAGQVGSSRQGIAEGLAVKGTQQALGDASASIIANAFNKGIDAQGRATALAPQVAGLATMPGSLLSAAGAQNRGFQQAAIDESVRRYDFGQNEELNRLGNLQQLIQGNLGGTTTQSGPPTQGPGLLGVAGGGLSGYAAGTALAGSMAGTAGLGTMAGVLPFLGPIGAAIGIMAMMS